MAKKYRLHVGLQLPPGSKGKYLDEGTEATAEDLAPLNVGALVSAGFVEEMPADLKCPACAETGTKKQKDEVFESTEALRAHYAADHVALAAPTDSEE